MGTEDTRKSFIEEFGEAYVRFGYPRLMGRIVGILMTTEAPLSLDDIAARLEVSKGPVSQLASRLRERQIIIRIGQPGDRKDYYQLHGEKFANAFRNLMTSMHQNYELACKYRYLLAAEQVDQSLSEDTFGSEQFSKNLSEMADFYELMLQHFRSFLEQWALRKQARP